MYEYIEKPLKPIKEAKPLRSKPKVSRFLCKDCGVLNSKIGKERYNGCINCGSTMTRSLPPAVPNRIVRKRAHLDREFPKNEQFEAKTVEALRWGFTRVEWFAANPPDYDDEYYQCKLCPFAVHKDETTLDHIQPRSTHPELKFVLSNLQAAHSVCNSNKGSMSMAEYLKKYSIPERVE